MPEENKLTEEQLVKLENAILDLNPCDDSNWTKDGLPKLDVVSAAFGGNVTRAQAEEAAENYNRQEAYSEHDVPVDEQATSIDAFPQDEGDTGTTQDESNEPPEDQQAPNPGKNDPTQAPIPGVINVEQPEIYIETDEERLKRIAQEQEIIAKAEKRVEAAQAKVNGAKEELIKAQVGFEVAVQGAEQPMVQVSLADANASFFTIRDAETEGGQLSALDRGFGEIGEIKPKRPNRV